MENRLKSIGDTASKALVITFGLAASAVLLNHGHQNLALRDSSTLQLCHNYNGVSFYSAIDCRVRTLSDDTKIIVEWGNDITPRLVDTFIGLQNGTKETQFEEPLPPEEADKLMLYNNLG